nr:hypothetical protein [Haloferax sp. BAB-2207]
MVLMFSIWQFVLELGGSLTLFIAGNLSLAGQIGEMIAQLFQSTPEGNQTLNGELDIGAVGFFTSFLALWLYQLILAIGVTLTTRDSYNNKNVFGLFIFSCICGLLALTVYLTSIPLVFHRVMSFFVVASIGLAIKGYYNYKQPSSSVYVVVILLLVLGASMTPMYVLSDSKPNYVQGESDQSLNGAMFAVAYFTDIHISQEIVADSTLGDVIKSKTKRGTLGKHQWIANGSVPTSTIVIINNRNDEIYTSSNLELERSITLRVSNTSSRFSLKNNKVYENGNNRIFI